MMRAFFLRGAVVIAFLALWQSVEPLPLPKPYDAIGQVRLMDWIISEDPDSYRMIFAEPFENLHPWTSRAPTSNLAVVKYIYKTPTEKAFLVEKDIVSSIVRGRFTFRQSLMVHTLFEHPGYDTFFIHPKVKIRLRGQLFRASLWVHSKNYYHKLVLLFENADGKEIRVNAGNLAWTGWKRISVRLPVSLFRRGRRVQKRYTHYFKGILIVSNPKQKDTELSLLFDNFIVLSNIKELVYPGTAYRDKW